LYLSSTTRILTSGRTPHVRREDMTMNPVMLKTLTFALLHFGVAFSVTYLLTGSIAVATGVGLIEPIVNTVAFHFHERAWRRAETRRARPSSQTACST
jgi:uncharacterized membrane protein